MNCATQAFKQLRLDVEREIIVDGFAGGGGMSTAIEVALGRSPDIAFNHNEDALSAHRRNHPQTRHFIADALEICPRGTTQGRPVGLFHLSPDCTHHSQAAGGQPRDRRIRALSWVGCRWAGQVKPRVITLENVKQILQWGPLIAKRCKNTGRVMKLDGTVAEPGERVPVQQQYLIPDKCRTGETWRNFVRHLERLGYKVEWRAMVAADYGAPTTRERLFMVARRDNKPIVWPEATHHKKPARGQRRWRAASECIDWNIPAPSIFERKKPLAAATQRRIAKGVVRYVLNSGDPFIVPIAHYNGRDACQPSTEPLRTITAATKGGEFAVCAPTLAQMNGGFNETPGRDIRAPMTTITNSGSQQQLVTAHLAHLRGHCDARSVDEPLRTVSAGGEHHGLVTAVLSRQFGASIGHSAADPLGTITAGGGGKSALIECHLSPTEEAGALRVAAFLMRYYSEGGQWGDLREPMDTITTRDRLALVTVTIKGTPYVIVDIGLRMLSPMELYRAQGFPETFTIDRGHDGRVFPKSAQVRMVGNSVSPPPAAALIAANCADLAIRQIPMKVTA